MCYGNFSWFIFSRFKHRARIPRNYLQRENYQSYGMHVCVLSEAWYMYTLHHATFPPSPCRLSVGSMQQSLPEAEDSGSCSSEASEEEEQQERRPVLLHTSSSSMAQWMLHCIYLYTAGCHAEWGGSWDTPSQCPVVHLAKKKGCCRLAL